MYTICMSYISPYQPGFNQKEIKRVGADAARSILQRSIVYGYEGIKFVIQFIQDALKQVIGK